MANIKLIVEEKLKEMKKGSMKQAPSGAPNGNGNDDSSSHGNSDDNNNNDPWRCKHNNMTMITITMMIQHLFLCKNNAWEKITYEQKKSKKCET